jgi:hypothetical protein
MYTRRWEGWLKYLICEITYVVSSFYLKNVNFSLALVPHPESCLIICDLKGLYPRFVHILLLWRAISRLAILSSN